MWYNAPNRDNGWIIYTLISIGFEFYESNLTIIIFNGKLKEQVETYKKNI